MDLALDIHTAGLHRQVLDLHGVQALFRHIDLPGGVSAVGSIHLGRTRSVLAQLAVAFEGGDVHHNFTGTGLDVRMSLLIDLIRIVTADAGHIRRQVPACILVMVVCSIAAQQDDTCGDGYHDQQSHKDTPLLFSHTLTTPVAIMETIETRKRNRNMTWP